MYRKYGVMPSLLPPRTLSLRRVFDVWKFLKHRINKINNDTRANNNRRRTIEFHSFDANGRVVVMTFYLARYSTLFVILIHL